MPNATAPATALGGIKADERFAGGVDVESGGWVPNITPHADGIGDWSESDIAEFLKTGFTPEFDSAGGSMAQVIQNTSRLSDEDRVAMAEIHRHAAGPPRKGAGEGRAEFLIARARPRRQGMPVHG